MKTQNKIVGGFIFAAIVMAGVLMGYLGNIYPNPEPAPDTAHPTDSFTFQDFLIVPETIGGFHIQEWPVASYDSHDSIYEVQLLLKGVGYTRGPVFNTRDKAERVMIWLGLECGL